MNLLKIKWFKSNLFFFRYFIKPVTRKFWSLWKLLLISSWNAVWSSVKKFYFYHWLDINFYDPLERSFSNSTKIFLKRFSILLIVINHWNELFNFRTANYRRGQWSLQNVRFAVTRIIWCWLRKRWNSFHSYPMMSELEAQAGKGEPSESIIMTIWWWNIRFLFFYRLCAIAWPQNAGWVFIFWFYSNFTWKKLSNYQSLASKLKRIKRSSVRNYS